jgi:hypothetical protein
MTMRVYQFRVFEIATDRYRLSARWATPQRIASLGGDLVGDGLEVGDDFMDPDVPGMVRFQWDPSKAPPRPRVRLDANGRDLDKPFDTGGLDYAGMARMERERMIRESREARPTPAPVLEDAPHVPDTAA